MTNSSDLTLRQEGMGSILQGFLSGVVNLMSNLFGISSDAINGVLINLLTSFNQAFSPPTAKPATGELGPDLDLDLFSNLSFGDSIQALLPLTSRRTGDLHQMTFGVINNKNRLIVTNIVSKEVENKTSIGDQREVLNQLSLNGLHSMMERLVSRMNNDTEPMYLASLQVSIIEEVFFSDKLKLCFTTLVVSIGRTWLQSQAKTVLPGSALSTSTHFGQYWPLIISQLIH